MRNNGKEIRVRIGAGERYLDDADEPWINEQINRRRQDKQLTCIRVLIKDSFVNMVLSTSDCSGKGGGSRLPNSQEKRIFDLWNRLGLNRSEFHAGNLIAFLKQVS